MHAQLGTAPSAGEVADAFTDLRGNAAPFAARHGRPTGSYGSFEGLTDPKSPEDFQPFRIKHTEGPDAEPTTTQSARLRVCQATCSAQQRAAC